jgi:hypothetical protein
LVAFAEGTEKVKDDLLEILLTLGVHDRSPRIERIPRRAGRISRHFHKDSVHPGSRLDGVASRHETRRARSAGPATTGRARPRSPRRTAPPPHAPHLERAERIGECWSYPQSRTFAELLIDCEEERTLRAVLVGMLSEGTQDEDVEMKPTLLSCEVCAFTSTLSSPSAA